MTGPLGGGMPGDDRKASKLNDGEKLTAILDLLGIVARALLSIFGKRRSDRQE